MLRLTLWAWRKYFQTRNNPKQDGILLWQQEEEGEWQFIVQDLAKNLNCTLLSLRNQSRWGGRGWRKRVIIVTEASRRSPPWFRRWRWTLRFSQSAFSYLPWSPWPGARWFHRWRWSISLRWPFLAFQGFLSYSHFSGARWVWRAGSSKHCHWWDQESARVKVGRD